MKFIILWSFLFIHCFVIVFNNNKGPLFYTNLMAFVCRCAFKQSFIHSFIPIKIEAEQTCIVAEQSLLDQKKCSTYPGCRVRAFYNGRSRTNIYSSRTVPTGPEKVFNLFRCWKWQVSLYDNLPLLDQKNYLCSNALNTADRRRALPVYSSSSSTSSAPTRHSGHI